MTVISSWLLATALICSFLFWRLWPLERRRIYGAWALIALDLVFTYLASPLQAPWMIEAGRAFGELAAVQLAVILFAEMVVRRWSMHMILSDLVALGAYVLVAFRLLSRLGTDVNGLIATSTVVTAIVGLSVQDILTNSAAGVILQFENEISQGDFLETDKGSGWVRRVRTRYTAIETPDSDVLIVPNQVLTRSPVKLSTAPRRTLISFQSSYEHLPTKVIEEVETVLRISLPEGVAKDPSPTCFVRTMQAGYIEYGVFVWVTTPGHQQRQISEVLLRIYFGLARAGMPLTSIPQKLEWQDQLSRSLPDPEQLSRSVLQNADLFRTLKQGELAFLLERLRPASFAPGETVVNQGDIGESVFIVMKGKLAVWLTGGDGRSEQVATLQPGSLFGEMSLLTGEPRSASVVAVDQVDCQCLDRPDFAHILELRPELAQEICDLMMERRSMLMKTRDHLNSTALVNERYTLFARIQSVFRIPRKAVKQAASVHQTFASDLPDTAL